MDWRSYFYLVWEFVRPASVGGYFDGQKLFVVGSEKRPARFYIAVSHKALYFGKMSVASLSSQEEMRRAAELEALRLLSLTEEREIPPVVASFSSNSELVFAFQSRDFFEKILRESPSGLVPCGIYPAGLALLPPKPEEGVYALLTSDRCEGVVIENGKLKDFLPADPQIAKVFLESYPGQKFVYQGDPAEYLLPRLTKVVELPPSLRIDFYPYRIKVRPQPTTSMILLLILPALVLGVCLYMTNINQRLMENLNAREKELKTLKKQLAETEKNIQTFERREKALEEINKFKQKKIDIYALLKDLTEAFPKEAWINRFTLSIYNNRLILYGEANDVLSIVKNLKKLSWVQEVKLSTVTRNPSTQKEHFSLTIKIKVPEGSKP